MNYDMEKLLDALRHVESRGNRFAVSPKGAKGAYQFMPETAKEYGLFGNDVFDEQKSRAAARKKLSGLISRYGLQGGIGAYNMGEGNLEKHKGNWAALPETAKYVPAVLAAYGGNQGDLASAGFKSMQQRPQPTDPGQFPIQMIPGVEPQSPVVEHKPNMKDEVMPVQEQPVSGHLVDFKKAQKDINRSKLLAQTLANVDWGDPNAMVSGRAVAMSPITAIAKALQQGIGTYEGAKAQGAQDDLETQKAQALKGMMAGGKVDINKLVESGLLSVEDWAKASATKEQQADHILFYDKDGQAVAFNKSTREVTPTGIKSALYAPDSVYNRSLASSAGKGVEMTDDQGRPYYVPQGQTNPAFGSYGQTPRLDYPTSMMPVPNSAPMQTPQLSNSAPIPQQPVSGVVKGASPVELKRQEAEAMIAPKVQEAQAVGAVKAQQDVALAQEKAAIENQQKIEQASQKKETAGKNIIDVLNTKINGKTVDELIDESTGSGIGAATDAGAAFFGQSTEGSVAADSLKTLQGWLVSNIPRMEGPQSDFDVQNYQQMAGKIADPNTPPDRKKAALASLKALVKKYETNPAKQTEIDPKKAELEQLRKELMQ